MVGVVNTEQTDSQIRVRRIGSTWYVVSGGASVGFADERDARDYAASIVAA